MLNKGQIIVYKDNEINRNNLSDAPEIINIPMIVIREEAFSIWCKRQDNDYQYSTPKQGFEKITLF